MRERRLLGPVTSETLVLGSRFIAYLAPVATVEEATSLLESVRREHIDASHHCWAYLIGQEMRFSDDGEPGGTAGRPMLEVLLKREIDRCAAVVVRYFGGRKLGAGGLVRAYSGAVAQALDRAEVGEFVPHTKVHVRAPFAATDAVLRVLEHAAAEFDAHGLSVTVVIEDRALEGLSARLRDATRGSAEVTILGPVIG